MNNHDLFPSDLYHSYIVEGTRDETIISLRSILESRGDISKENPDLLCQSYDIFTLADNSLVQEWHNNKNISDTKKICILAMHFINREAEQALLKILEEPKENTHFFLIVPNASSLIETIRSRSHIVRFVSETQNHLLKESLLFLKSAPKQRIDMVATIIERNKGNDNSGGLRHEAMELVTNLESTLYKQNQSVKGLKVNEFSLKELQKARMYLGTPGASVKMILEHIALVI